MADVKPNLTELDIAQAREEEQDKIYAQKILSEKKVKYEDIARVGQADITMKEAGVVNDYLLSIGKNEQEWLEERAPLLATVFIKVCANIVDRDYIDYTLTLMEQLLEDEKGIFLKAFVLLGEQALEQREKEEADEKKGEDKKAAGKIPDPYVHLMKILRRQDDNPYQVRKACRIMSLVLSAGAEKVPFQVMDDFFKWLCPRMKEKKGHDQLQVLSAVKEMLKNKATHAAFAKEDGVWIVASLMKKDTLNTQLLYLVGFSIWLLSFNEAMLPKFQESNVVDKLVSIVRVVVREKVVRICFATLANLLTKPFFTQAMIGSDLHRVVANVMARKWKDKDLLVDMDLVAGTLRRRLSELSSFEMYLAELTSDNLHKSPVHNEKFWRENYTKFEVNGYDLIKKIVANLGSEREETVEMACYDLGEFVRFHPDGRKVINSKEIDGKTKLMLHMNDKNVAVAKAALLAVQKIMVLKWDQMIGTQLSEA